MLLWWPRNPSSRLRPWSVRDDSWVTLLMLDMVPHLSAFGARNSRCGSGRPFLESTPCSPSPLHWGPEPQPNVRPWMSHFHLCYWWTGHKHNLWGWRYLPSHAERARCFHFVACLSPLVLSIQMLLFMLMWERLIFLTWIDNVGCGAHFLANQCKGSKQYVFVLTFFPL